MRIHHLSCGTMCPIGRRFVHGSGGAFARSEMVCHCLLVETSAGLVLVDSGLGLEDYARPVERLGRLFVAAMNVRLDPELSAVRQIEGLGLDPSDVRHVVLTHLDLDHAGGISDFPRATVHLLAAEREAATARRTFVERHRYRTIQWAHAPRFATYEARGEAWMGFPCVRDLDGLPPEILLVPLIGHTRGHAGVAIDDGDHWLLHAGDAYFFHGEVDPVNPRSPAALAAFQRVMAVDDRMRRDNQTRLRELVRVEGARVRVFSAHDPIELAREQGAARA